MLVQQHRFRGHSSVRRVYARGETVRGSCATLRILYNNKQPTWRAAVVVSRKVHKSAVVRNRIRRRIYEIFRQCDIPEGCQIDFVLIVHKVEVADMAYEELYSLLARQIQKALNNGK